MKKQKKLFLFYHCSFNELQECKKERKSERERERVQEREREKERERVGREGQRVREGINF